MCLFLPSVLPLFINALSLSLSLKCLSMMSSSVPPVCTAQSVLIASSFTTNLANGAPLLNLIPPIPLLPSACNFTTCPCKIGIGRFEDSSVERSLLLFSKSCLVIRSFSLSLSFFLLCNVMPYLLFYSTALDHTTPALKPIAVSRSIIAHYTSLMHPALIHPHAYTQRP